ncbi:MAG TPA: hypothetical protein VKZ84_03730 [Bacteriovoracaceae bacterium]|nr:hypothetical protein [Bacteriovoracaceae bacterium]
MRTAIAVDSLLSRDEAVFLLELVLNLFPNSEIYTIAHKRGGILGQIETRPIVSSYLTHKVQNLEDFKKSLWILPSAIKGIPLHKSIEKVIVLSRGYVHSLKLPENVERFLYIVDWDMINQSEIKGWRKWFLPYVNESRLKALTQFPQIAVSSQALAKRLELPNAQVIYPTFRTEEYPFVKDEDHNFEFDHHLVYTHGMTREEFWKLVNYIISQGDLVRVMGPDEDKKDLFANNPKVDFAGDHCEATAAMYSHKAKVIWDMSKSFFPAKAFGALCTGRPVVVRDNEINREFLVEGAYFLDLEQNLESIFKKANSEFLSFDRRSLRRKGLRWNERLFKSKMTQFFERDND